MSLLRASTGAIVNLGQLLGRGGEGTVHAVVGAPKLVAKVYLKPPDAAKADKLRHMIRGASPGLLDVSAWPVDLLTDERGAVRGFLMGRISARQDAHRLYTPKSRRGTFPDADFRFVVRAATNLSRAFAQIHAARHVIGDVNHGNALIGKDGTAVLIDCDSIQVRDRHRVFTCDVGTPLFTPPELQGKSFRGLRRLEESDRFGLAVLVFHLLFQGRHPFAGVYAEGEMPVERAIAESRFAYGAHAGSLGMSPPPGTLPLSTFGWPIARLFERAFAPPGGEEQRPSAIEWIEELRALEMNLSACHRRPRHYFPGDGDCCWCAIENRTGARLFGEGQVASIDLDAVSAEQLWKAIEGVSPPKVLTLPDSVEAESKALEGKGKRGGDSAGVLALIIFGIPLAFALSMSLEMSLPVILAGGIVLAEVFRKKVLDAVGPSPQRAVMRHELKAAITEWRKHSSSELFSNARSYLAEIRKKIVVFNTQQQKDLDRIKEMLEVQQLRKFLDKFDIGSTTLPMVTRAHIEKLASRGVRSAGDIRRRRRKMIDILPEVAMIELRRWAAQCADQYKFDTRDPAYVAEAMKIEEKYGRLRSNVLEELRRGPELLANRREEVDKARARAEDVLRRKADYLRQRREKIEQ